MPAPHVGIEEFDHQDDDHYLWWWERPAPHVSIEEGESSHNCPSVGDHLATKVDDDYGEYDAGDDDDDDDVVDGKCHANPQKT